MKFWNRLGWGEGLVHREAQSNCVEVTGKSHILPGAVDMQVYTFVKTH